jgi:hypothetical protein
LRIILAFILLLNFSFASKRADIVLDSKTNKEVGVFLFKKITTFVKNNFGFNPLHSTYKNDTKLEPIFVRDLVNDNVKNILTEISKKVDNEVQYDERSLFKNINDMRISVTVGDIHYNLSESFTPEIGIKDVNSLGPVFDITAMSKFLRVEFKEIKVALEIPVDKVKTKVDGKLTDVQTGDVWWGPVFIIRDTGLTFDTKGHDLDLSFDAQMQIIKHDENKLRPSVLKTDFSKLVSVIETHPEIITFNFPHFIEIPKFGFRNNAIEIILFGGEKSEENFRNYLAKPENQNRLKNTLVAEIIKQLKDGRADSLLKSMEVLRFDRDHLINDDDYATIIRIEDILGSSWREKVQVKMPGHICTDESKTNSLKQLEEVKGSINQQMNKFTYEVDNDEAIEDLQDEMRTISDDFQEVVNMCKEESNERLEKVERVLSHEEGLNLTTNPFSFMREEKGIKLSISSKFITNYLWGTYEKGAWNPIFEGQAVLGDRHMITLFDTVKSDVAEANLYMDLIFYDLSGMEKFALSFKQMFKKRKKVQEMTNDLSSVQKKYIEQAEKGKAIRFPVHMRVSGKFEMRKQKLCLKSPDETPEEHKLRCAKTAKALGTSYEEPCFDTSGNIIKGEVPYFVFTLNSAPILEEANKNSLENGLDVRLSKNETIHFPSNIKNLVAKEAIYKKIDESFGPYVGKEVLASKYCNLRDLDIDKIKLKTLGDGRLTIVIPVDQDSN